jgi:hypothetical protein
MAHVVQAAALRALEASREAIEAADLQWAIARELRKEGRSAKA